VLYRSSYDNQGIRCVYPSGRAGTDPAWSTAHSTRLGGRCGSSRPDAMTGKRNCPSPDQLSDQGQSPRSAAVPCLRFGLDLGLYTQRNYPRCQRNSVSVGHRSLTDPRFRPAHPGSAVPPALPSQAAVWHPVRSERCKVPDCRPTARCLARRPTFRYAALWAAAAPNVPNSGTGRSSSLSAGRSSR
jgi:hypothetical protein